MRKKTHFVINGWSRADWEDVHPNGGLANRPKPVTFGEISFSEKSTPHFHGGVPVSFDSPILGLPMWGGGTNLYSMRTKKATDLALKETPIKITPETGGKPPCIDEETPKSIHDGFPSQVAESVDPGVAGG
jgi:hypothetical protein